MNIPEHLAKKIVSDHGVPVPAGWVVDSADGARSAALAIGGVVAVKADVAMLSRGSVGGVRLAADAAAAAVAAADLLGKPLGADGPLVRHVLVEAAAEVAHEYYVAVMVDPEAGCLVLLGSRNGGAGVETSVGAGADLVRVPIRAAADDVVAGLDDAVVGFVAAMEFSVPATGVVGGLCRALVAADAQLVEVNPLAVTVDQDLVALDVKIALDGNADGRRPGSLQLRGVDEETSGGLNFVRLDGNVAVVANGAGLALATNDMVADAGGRPANFMDIRTTATSMEIAQGFEVLFDLPQVQSLLVNVHGGGMTPCDTVASALGMAVRRRVRDGARLVPIVVRLAGNHAMFARTVLKNSGVPHADVPDLSAAVRHAVAAAR